jgi:hypothetical protein
MNSFLSGMLAGLPLSVLGVSYALIRFETVATVFRDGDPGMEATNDRALRLMLLAMFGASPLLLGGIAGLVYGAVDSLT